MHTARSTSLALALLTATSPALLAQVKVEDREVPTPGGTIQSPASWDVVLDGDRLAIGDGFGFATSPPAASRGRVIAYERSGVNGDWQIDAELFPSQPLGLWGFSVRDVRGGRIVCAVDDDASIHASTGLESPGLILVFDRQVGGAWQETGRFHRNPPGHFDEFGRNAVFDGEQVVEWSPGRRVSATGQDTAGDWTAYQSLHSGTGTIQEFPADVVTQDGVLLALEDVWVHVFERDTNEQWSLAQTVTLPNQRLATYVAMLDDTAIVTYREPQPGGGEAWGNAELRRDTNGTWSHVADLPTGSRVRGFAGADRLVLERVSTEPWVGDVFERGANGAWSHALTLEFPRSGGRIASVDTDGVLVVAPIVPGSGERLVHVDLGTLYRDVRDLSVSAGGVQRLLLRTGAQHGGSFFVVAGSTSGTSPGISDPVSGLHVPLVLDGYTTFLLQQLGGGLVAPMLGVLDADGRAESAFTVPAGVAASFVGQSVHHACLVVDPVTLTAVHVTNAVEAVLVP